MTKQARLRLKGYFDYNFGDDYMMKVIIDIKEIDYGQAVEKLS